MPLDLLKRRGSKPGSRVEVPPLLPEEVESQEYALKLQYRAKGREGVRMSAGLCAHCGFASGHERAFYCPKCGMRVLRG